MHILTGKDFENARFWMKKAQQTAKKSRCLKARCGSVIVSRGQIIGSGFNSPAKNEPNRCLDNYVIPKNNKHDITCCPHAEVRAIHDAYLKNPKYLKIATIYFIRVDDLGNQTFAGVPFCTICSKEALDSGIKYFVLWHKQGITQYDTKEYNDLSYKFFKDKSLWKLK